MHRHVAHPHIDPAPLEAFRASMRDWLVGVLAWLVDHLSAAPKSGLRGAIIAHPLVAAAIAKARREVTADLRQSVRELRMLLIALAYARVAPIVHRRIATAPAHRGAPSGFRFSRHQSGVLRQVIGDALKGVHEGSLCERAKRLRDLLDNLDPLIARVAARMARMLHTGRGPALVLVCAEDAVRHLCAAHVLEAADSS
jgi:hypothetical protein